MSDGWADEELSSEMKVASTVGLFMTVISTVGLVW